MLGFEPVRSASEACCPTQCAMGTIGISDNSQGNYENLWPKRDSNPALLLETFVPS